MVLYTIITQLLLLHNHLGNYSVLHHITNPKYFSVVQLQRLFPSAEYLVLSDRGPAAAAPGAP